MWGRGEPHSARIWFSLFCYFQMSNIPENIPSRQWPVFLHLLHWPRYLACINCTQCSSVANIRNKKRKNESHLYIAIWESYLPKGDNITASCCQLNFKRACNSLNGEKTRTKIIGRNLIQNGSNSISFKGPTQSQQNGTQNYHKYFSSLFSSISSQNRWRSEWY